MKAMFMMILFMSLISGFVVFLSMRMHLLLTLISIEFLMLIIYLFMFMNFLSYGIDLYFMLIYLIMMVCEGALGLSMLVVLIRSHGNDMINSLNMLLW
uniref:NADH dehydrogenase subunit 4L n=1 Tax=Eteoneus sigillatus TaxID=1964414 RepID=UPI0030032618|nr:NADH dehydrogenase subunit 4L [Eteoneus sigillatus]